MSKSGRQHCVQQKLPSFFLRMHFDPFSGARFRCSATQSHAYACRLVGGGGADLKATESLREGMRAGRRPLETFDFGDRPGAKTNGAVMNGADA